VEASIEMCRLREDLLKAAQRTGELEQTLQEEKKKSESLAQQVMDRERELLALRKESALLAQSRVSPSTPAAATLHVSACLSSSRVAQPRRAANHPPQDDLKALVGTETVEELKKMAKDGVSTAEQAYAVLDAKNAEIRRLQESLARAHDQNREAEDQGWMNSLFKRKRSA
jgi:hypothetical protein